MKADIYTIIDIINGKITDGLYRLRVEESERLLLHYSPNKRLISNLLTKRFPNEPGHVLEYKLNNWKSITKTYIDKIINVLSKIRKSDEFGVSFPNVSFRDEINLRFKQNGYDNFWDWAFNRLLTAFVIEPNGGWCISKNDSGNAPKIEIFRAENVIYVSPDFWIVRYSDSEYAYIDEYEYFRFLVTKQHAFSNSLEIEEIQRHEHGLEFIPANLLGGKEVAYDTDNLFTSIISGVCPFFDQALLAFSELDAGVKQHVFPDKWRYLTGSCTNCNGTGKVSFVGVGGKTEYANCHICGGTGDPPTGMFAEILITPSNGLTTPPPIPPLGYVQKDFEPITFLNQYYKDMLKEGLRAVNMEFLYETPLNESGRAKELDRAELSSFLFDAASIFIATVRKILITYAKLIYPEYTIESIKKEILPVITVPRNFDFINEMAWSELIETRGKIAPEIYSAIEKRVIEKKFAYSNEDRAILLLCNAIDPLRGWSEEAKIEAFESGAVTELDFVLSINIRSVVMQVIEGTYGYSILNKPISEQIEIVKKEAKKILKQITNSSNNHVNSIKPISNKTLSQSIE